VTNEYALLSEIVRRLVECGVVEDRVYECRGESISEDRLPAIDVTLYETTPTEIGRSVVPGATRHDLDVRVDVYVRSDGLNGSALELADPIVDMVHRTLLADRTLGGRCALVSPGQRRWNKAVTNGVQLQVEQCFRVIHATRTGDLSLSA
jgi:hypothetical protein